MILKKIIYTLICFASISIQAQKCDYVYNFQNPRTMSTQKMIWLKAIAQTRHKEILDIGLSSSDHECMLTVAFDENQTCVNENSHLVITLKNKDNIILFNVAGQDCAINNDLVATFFLEKEDMNRLEKSPIKKIKLAGAKTTHTFNKICDRKFFVKNIKCIR